ncbi:melatonin receptor type 1B-B-like [Actinia tenebrosa]|uniref:Melatonin receptor type 1B-B-like n=1 Tax=Actinia tenebrosa TaxID=6105 RepID=A0A6P8IGZ0_ACTTE|nr:melatonin receptor type 1B-B-like [Actinia tenebrosa]
MAAASEKRLEHLSSQLLDRSQQTVGIEGTLGIANELLCLFGNILVITATFRNPSLRRQTYIYIISMAINDMVMAIIPMTLACYVIIRGKWDLGDGVCELQGYVEYMSSIGTMFLFSLISINRFVRILHPNYYRRIYTNRFIILTIVILWVLVAGIVASFGFTAGFNFHPGFMVCTMNHDKMNLAHLVMSIVVFSVIPFEVTWYCYYKIWRFVQTHNANMNNSVINRDEIKITRTMFLVIVSFTFCMTPFLVVTIYESVFGQYSLDRKVYFFCLGMRSMVSFINPFIYAVLNKSFRSEFVKILHLRLTRSKARVQVLLLSQLKQT